MFGPAAIAGKDQLITLQRDNLKDLLARSVIIRMERPKQYMPQLDDRADARGEELGKALAAVMGALQGEMQQAVQDLDREAAATRSPKATAGGPRRSSASCGRSPCRGGYVARRDG